MDQVHEGSPRTWGPRFVVSRLTRSIVLEKLLKNPRNRKRNRKPKRMKSNIAPSMRKSVTTIPNIQRFHLEGNFLPEGNFGLWKEIWKEIAFGRKLGGNIVIRREMRRKFYFIS
jgi:hypothetical protein